MLIAMLQHILLYIYIHTSARVEECSTFAPVSNSNTGKGNKDYLFSLGYNISGLDSI